MKGGVRVVGALAGPQSWHWHGRLIKDHMCELEELLEVHTTSKDFLGRGGLGYKIALVALLEFGRTLAHVPSHDDEALSSCCETMRQAGRELMAGAAGN